MKVSRILQATILLTISALMFSCSSSRRTTDRRYPPYEYPYPDAPPGQPYPGNPPYPDGRYPSYPPNGYPVYRDPNPYNLPPGQAKKIYGRKSARPYAPGQRKKYAYNQRTFPLIIFLSRDMVINRDIRGRLYYQDPYGVLYWKGYDNRYYLDEKFLPDARYSQQEYNDWNYRGKRREAGRY